MASALRDLGFDAVVSEKDRGIRLITPTGVSGYWANGRLVVNGTAGVDENQIRRAYSKQSVLKTARTQGWQVRFRPNGDIEATRRRFS